MSAGRARMEIKPRCAARTASLSHQSPKEIQLRRSGLAENDAAPTELLHSRAIFYNDTAPLALTAVNREDFPANRLAREFILQSHPANPRLVGRAVLSAPGDGVRTKVARPHLRGAVRTPRPTLPGRMVVF